MGVEHTSEDGGGCHRNCEAQCQESYRPPDGVRTSAVSDVAVYIYKYQGPGHDIPRLYCKFRSTADCVVSTNI